MSSNINFLEPETDQIRQSILGIDDSYNNPWDILAEILQNSVDAIREEHELSDSDNYTGKIKLVVNLLEKSISIVDNGIGILNDKVPSLLRPFSTNKKQKSNLIGEKGVGLTFVVFSSNYFKIITTHDNKTFKGEIENAYSWKTANNDELPSITTMEVDNLQTNGTTIVIDKIQDSSIFDLTFEQLKYVLRSKTAIGSTKALLGEDINIDISVEYISSEGAKKEQIPFKYFSIDEVVNSKSKIDYNQFNSSASNPDMSDIEKSNLIKNKVIYEIGTISHNSNRTLKYEAVYVPNRSVWNSKSVEQKLASEVQIDNDDWMIQYGFSIFEPGIYLAVKGMPTGISIAPPSTGAQGYWSNIFIIIEDDQLSFDIGRKSIHGMQANIYRTYAKKIFQKFTKIVQKFTAGTGYLDESSKWEKDKIFTEISKINDLQSSNTSFIKEPERQEANVVGMFYDMLGRNVITNISPLSTGYKGKYDLYAKSNGSNVSIEFKATASSILRDFNEYIKMFSEIDCIVCWNVTSNDITLFDNVNLTLSEYKQSEFDQSKSKFDQATHILTGYQQAPIYIIDLKTLI